MIDRRFCFSWAIGDLSLGDKEQSVSDWQKITYDIPYDKLILSVRRTHVSSLATTIQALVLVHQRLDGMNEIFVCRIKQILFLVVTLKTIAYCRFPLYIPRTIGQLNVWDVAFGTIKRPLHPGQPPFAIETIPDVPKLFIAGKWKLIRECWLSIKTNQIRRDFYK